MSDKLKGKRARLIPVVGTRMAREAEQRATSAFLAVLSIVRDFSKDLLNPMGASSAKKATVDTYTEVSMDEVRPDGLIRVTWGKQVFTALVEVKTGNNNLDRDQLKRYLQLARKKKYQHLITISNEIAPPRGHPVQGLGITANSRVKITHLSWFKILSTALRLKNHKGVDDPEQAWILEELVRYMQHDASGVLPLADMGASWRLIRDGARNSTLHHQTEELNEVARKIDEMHEFAALQLSTEIGRDVIVQHSRAFGESHPRRIASFAKDMIAGRPILSQFRIPDTAGPVSTAIDLKAQHMTASIEVMAPGNVKALGRINWILRQLGKAPDKAIVETYSKGARKPLSATLESVRADRSRKVLLGEKKSEAHRFVVRLQEKIQMGRKASRHHPGFIEGYMTLITKFYDEVIQDLTAWQPPAPKRIVEADEAETEVPMD